MFRMWQNEDFYFIFPRLCIEWKLDCMELKKGYKERKEA